MWTVKGACTLRISMKLIYQSYIIQSLICINLTAIASTVCPETNLEWVDVLSERNQ